MNDKKKVSPLRICLYFTALYIVVVMWVFQGEPMTFEHRIGVAVVWASIMILTAWITMLFNSEY